MTMGSIIAPAASDQVAPSHCRQTTSSPQSRICRDPPSAHGSGSTGMIGWMPRHPTEGAKGRHGAPQLAQWPVWPTTGQTTVFMRQVWPVTLGQVPNIIRSAGCA